MPSMRLNTTAAVPKGDENGWQVVGDPKAKPITKVPDAVNHSQSKKSEPAKQPVPSSAPPPKDSSSSLCYGSSTVLAELDRQWEKQQSKLRKVCSNFLTFSMPTCA